MNLNGKQKHRVKIGGRLRFSSFSPEVQQAIKDRLAEKDDVLAQNLKGVLVGLKIDGKQVTKDNVHEFEIKSRADQANPKEQSDDKKYSKQDLQDMEFSDLKDIAERFGETGRSKKGLIRDILKAQEK